MSFEVKCSKISAPTFPSMLPDHGEVTYLNLIFLKGKVDVIPSGHFLPCYLLFLLFDWPKLIPNQNWTVRIFSIGIWELNWSFLCS